ncbi:MAG: hypothetical protein SFY81_16285 [Verrucomicrobiota bacterium]|nr:hypothetical protein [Verrucomicrobiota bacterium]
MDEEIFVDGWQISARYFLPPLASHALFGHSFDPGQRRTISRIPILSEYWGITLAEF